MNTDCAIHNKIMGTIDGKLSIFLWVVIMFTVV